MPLRSGRDNAVHYREKPKITVRAHINCLRGGNAVIENMREGVEYDLYYVEIRSFLCDLWSMLRTPSVGFVGKNAYNLSFPPTMFGDPAQFLEISTGFHEIRAPARIKCAA